MLIRCSNGHKLKAKIKLAGKSIRCPACGVVVKIPDASAFEADVESKQNPRPATNSSKSTADIPDDLDSEVFDNDSNTEGEANWGSDWTDDGSDTEYSDARSDHATKLPPRKNRKAVRKPKVARKQAVKGATNGEWGPLHWAAVAGGGIVSLLLIGLLTWLFRGQPEEPGVAVTQENILPDNTPPPASPPNADSETPASPQIDSIDSRKAAESRLLAQQRLAAQVTADLNKTMPPQDETPSAAVETANDVPAVAANPNAAKRPAASATKTRRSVVRPRGGLSLVASHPRITKVKVGQSVLLRMAKGVTGVAFSVVPLADDAQAEPTPNWIQPFEPSAADPDAIRLHLSASIFGTQKVILLDSVGAVRAVRVPFKIRIGQEIMTVTQIDGFKDAFRVERPKPMSHSVTEGVFVINEQADVQGPIDGVPTLDKGQLLWVPGLEDVGRNVVSVRGTPTSSRMANDWAWEVEVLEPREPRPSAAVAEPDFALIESFDPIRPLPDQPNALLTIEQKRAKSKDSKSLQKSTSTLLRKKSGLAAQFESVPDGTIKVSLQTLDFQVNQDFAELPQQVLSFGAGVPLVKTKPRWEKSDRQQVSKKLLQETEPSEYPEGDPVVRMHRLNTIVEQSGKTDRFRKVLASTTGNWLYVLTNDGHLLQIDVVTWEVTTAINRSDGFRDMCWSSAGLVLLKSEGRLTSRNVDLTIVEPLPGNRPTQPKDLLLILDPESLEITYALAIGGQSLAGDPEQDLVYVDQSADHRIAVVNVADGTLVNSVTHRSLIGPKEPELPLPPGSIDDLSLIGNGSALVCRLRKTLRDGNSNIYRFAISGVNIAPEESSGLIPVVEPFHTSPDGQVVSFTSKTTQSGLNFFPTANIGGSGHSLYTKFPATQHALDAASRSIVYSQPVTTSGMRIEGDYGKIELHVRRADKTFVIPLGLENIIDMVSLPGERGILVTTDKSTLWMEFVSKAPQWTFEKQTPATLPISRCEIASFVPQEPMPWTKATNEKELQNFTNSKRLFWGPKRTAFYALTGETIHRFDAATKTETHRWTAEKIESTYGRIVPGFFATPDGLIFDQKNNRTVYLLSFEDLSPVWQLPTSYAYRPSGSPLHNRVVAMCKAGIVIFEAASARVVARASFMDLWREWPTQRNDRLIAATATSKPDFVSCQRDKILTLRVDEGRLKFDGDSQ